MAVCMDGWMDRWAESASIGWIVCCYLDGWMAAGCCI